MNNSPLLYDDLDERKLGRQTRIDQQATQQLDDEVVRRENEVAEQEVEVADTNKRNLREDALQAIELIQQQDDPIAALEELPPSLQAEVKAILDEQQPEQPQEAQLPQAEQVSEVPLEGEPTIGDGGQGNILDTATTIPEPSVNLPVLRQREPDAQPVEEEKRRNLLPLQ